MEFLHSKHYRCFTLNLCIISGSSSVHRDLAWEPEGHRFKSSRDHSTECGLVAGEVPVHLPGAAAAELPLSKALNPNRSSRAAQWLAVVIRAFLQKRATLSVNLP